MMTDFQYFLTMAEELNFTRAAERLYISQPALTKYIRRLEERLGAALFDRTTTPVQLTYAGHLYLEYAQNTIRQEQELLQQLQEIGSEDRGRIRLGITNFRSTILLPDVLPLFYSRYPKVKVELTEGQSRTLGTALANDSIDLCIANPTDIINYTEFNCENIFSEPLRLAVSDHYARLREFVPDPDSVARLNHSQHYPLIDIAALADEPFIMLHPYQSIAYTVENHLQTHGITLHNVMRTANLMTTINLAAAGLGFGFVPATPLRRGSYPDNLLYFNIAQEDIKWDISVFYPRNRTLSKFSRAFVDVTRELYVGSRT